MGLWCQVPKVILPISPDRGKAFYRDTGMLLVSVDIDDDDDEGRGY